MPPRTAKRARSNSASAASADARHAGRFIWVEMRCRPLDHAAGERDAADREVVAVLRDVSDRKAQEQAIEIARAEPNAPMPPRAASSPP